MNHNLWLIKTNKLPVIIFLSGCIKKTKCIWFTANHNGYGIIIKNWKKYMKLEKDNLETSQLKLAISIFLVEMN